MVWLRAIDELAQVMLR